MPFQIDSNTFADEFNTGSNTEFTAANVADEITATIQFSYSNIIDASVESNYKLSAVSVTFLGATTQGFQLNNAAYNAYPSELFEYFQNQISGFEITATDLGSANGVYTFKGIASASNGNTIIVCNEAVAGTNAGNLGVLAITERLTTCNLDYRINGSNGGGYTPPIKISGGGTLNLKTVGTDLDANNVTPVDVPDTFLSENNNGSFTIKGIGITNDIQSFEISHIFNIVPVSIYVDGSTFQPSDLAVNGNDLGNIFSNGGAGKYSFEGSFGNSVNGGFQVSVNDPRAGKFFNFGVNYSTFSQKYGSGTTKYSYSNFSIIRTSDSEVSNVPLIQSKFTVSFDVDNTEDNPFSNSNTKVKIGIENIPQNFDNSADYEQSFLYDRAITTLGSGAISGVATGDASSITNYTTTYVSNAKISVSFDVEFGANAQAQISSDYFSIFVETQNHLKNYTDSDKVTLQVFKGLGINNILLDPITVDNTQFITSPYQDFSEGIDSSEINGFPVQMVVGSTQFKADWTNRTNLRIDKVSQLLVLKNSSTLEEIELDTTFIPVNTFNLISDEYPNTNNYSIQKGFKIPATEVRNLIEMTNISDVSSIRTFEVRFPFFIRWEDYTELINMTAIPSSILDNTQPFDGKNYNINRIDDIANWSLSYRITVDSSENTTLFSQDFDYTIPTTGYNAHPSITARTIKSYKPDGVTLQPTLPSGKQAINSIANTWIKYEATFTSTPASIGDFEIEIFAEVSNNGSPTKIQRISSVNSLLSSSWFTDTGAGDGKVLKLISGNKAIGECLIDFNKLSKYDSYRLYGSIYDPKRPTEYILAESGDNLVAENSDKLIRDF